MYIRNNSNLHSRFSFLSLIIYFSYLCEAQHHHHHHYNMTPLFTYILYLHKFTLFQQVIIHVEKIIKMQLCSLQFGCSVLRKEMSTRRKDSGMHYSLHFTIILHSPFSLFAHQLHPSFFCIYTHSVDRQRYSNKKEMFAL